MTINHLKWIALAGVLILPANVALAGGNGNGQSKLDICHVTGNGDIVRNNIAASAEQAHLNHGDHSPFDVWPDFDGDSFGDAGAVADNVCETPDGFVEDNLDCDDSDPAIHPLAEEVCDDVDNNCDGRVDEDGVCGVCPCYDAADLAAINISSCGSFPDRARLSFVTGTDNDCHRPTTASSASVRLFCRFTGYVGTGRKCIPFDTGVVQVTPDEMAACEQLIADQCP